MPVELGYCTENCTALGNVLYETKISKQLSKIESLDIFTVLRLQFFPLGMHPISQT